MAKVGEGRSTTSTGAVTESDVHFNVVEGFEVRVGNKEFVRGAVLDNKPMETQNVYKMYLNDLLNSEDSRDRLLSMVGGGYGMAVGVCIDKAQRNIALSKNACVSILYRFIL